MEENRIIKYEHSQLQKVQKAIAVTNKLLALTEPQLIPYRKKENWGFCTPDKKIIIDCMYKDAFYVDNEFAVIRTHHGYWGLLEIESKNIFYCLHLLLAPNFNEKPQEYKVVKWHCNIGGEVKKGDLLSSLDITEATLDFECSVNGTIVHLNKNKGGVFRTGEIYAILIENGENHSEIINSIKYNAGLNLNKTFFENFIFDSSNINNGYISKSGIEYWEN